MSTFEPNKLVKKYIEKKDKIGLKSALIAIISSNRSFSNKEFDETLLVIKKNEINIYEEYDGEDIICNTVKGRSFTEDDFEEAVCSLKVNFCQERIDDVERIGKELYGRNSDNEESTFIIDEDGGNSGKNQMSHPKNVIQTQENTTMKIVKGLAVVAAAAIVVGLAIKIMK